MNSVATTTSNSALHPALTPGRFTPRHATARRSLIALASSLLAFAASAAADPAPLDRIAVVRLAEESDGNIRQQNAILHHDGRLVRLHGFDFPRPANTPARAFGRNLVCFEAWMAYRALGYDALVRFAVEDGGNIIEVGTDWYVPVTLNLEAPRTDGRLINLSARASIGGASGPAVVGFVIDEQARTVLIRAVGPTLSKFGIGAPAPDPFLSLQRQGQTIYFNDNWHAAGEAVALRTAAAHVGAFPLEEGSRDAARLVELPPGVYTIAVEAAAASIAAGDVLIEIYSVPASALEAAKS